MEDQKKCSRCESELDTSGYPLWCRKCRAKNQREYNSLNKQMSESRGFAAGQSAAKARMIQFFQGFPAAQFSGAEVAYRIQTMDSRQSSG